MEELIGHIQNRTFPCIMAKAVVKAGQFKVHEVENIEDESVIKNILQEIYTFIDGFRDHPEKLSSFALVIKSERYRSFQHFEEKFWDFLNHCHEFDKKVYPHDERVSPDPSSERFSFSLKSEAFFLVALHPESPRWARRFKYPTIVFNPHIQFEELREKGIFKKVRDLIRLRDKLLQGSINPMLSDFGEKSEVFQYLGKVYGEDDPIPLAA